MYAERKNSKCKNVGAARAGAPRRRPASPITGEGRRKIQRDARHPPALMPSRKKNVAAWLGRRDRELLDAIGDACMAAAIEPPRGGSVTFVVPSAEDREAIIDAAYDGNTEDAVELVNECFIMTSTFHMLFFTEWLRGTPQYDKQQL